MADINISELPLISLATNDDVFIINDANATTSQITWSQLQNSIQSLTGQVTFSQGSAESPSITFTGDLNLGVFSPGLDTLAFTTNGSERMRIDPSGNVAIGLSAPSNFSSNAYNLVVGNTASSDNGITVVSSTVDTGNLYFADGTGAGSEDAGQITYDHSDNHLHFSTVASERMRINAVGNVGIGTSAIKSNLHVRGGDSGITATPSGQSGIIVESGAAESGALQFYNAPGTNAYVNFGDSGSLDVGYIRYDHNDNKLSIQTLGSERLHLTSAGDLGLGVSPTNTVLDINNPASGSSSYTGVGVSSVIQSDVTLDFRYFRSTAGTQNTTFNLTSLYHFSATQGTFGGTSSVDSQYGFAVDSGMSGATNNYGFYSGLNQAANTYGFYAAGSADHYFNGDNFIVANGGTETARFSDGNLTVSKSVVFTGGSTAARPSPIAGLMRFNSDIASWEGYNGFSWGAIGGGATTTSSPPSNANEGDIWFDIDEGRTYIYYNDGDSNQWVEMNPSLNGGVANGSISTPQLADGAVTDVKILDLNVTNSKLATNSVSTTKIQDGSVTPAKLDRAYLTDAPTDGNSYVRRSGTWEPSISGASANSTFPTATAIGQQHYNTNDGRLYIVIEDAGSNLIWVDASPDSENALVFSGVNPPNSPENGNLWWDSELGRLFVYYVDDNGDGQWVEASPQVTGFTYDEASDTWETGSNLGVDGELLIGTDNTTDNLRLNAKMAIVNSGSGSTSHTGLMMTNYSSSSGVAPFLDFNKSRSDTDGGKTAVQAEDSLGFIVFRGTDGDEFHQAASIESYVDGTTGNNDLPGRLVFKTTADGASTPAERMRIDRNGKWYLDNVDLFDPTYLGQIRINNTGGLLFRNGSTSARYPLGFQNSAGTFVGSVSAGNSSTQFNTSSDYRLKENVVAITDGISRLKQLQPKRFNFIIEAGKTVDGFIAHEAQAVVPEAVTGEKDAVDDKGNPVHQGIDQSKLVPLLTAALQEAVAKIETLEARLNTLEEGLN
ncbi:hypothetical protein [Synechococcus phage S-N03]|uniref:Peptidase S74 domain-containing protein n=1 Tax=Synechococcus phage S-N03 TaxID=2718943 RepID=A0A6G8R655_9CAUD|nr:hypothetical protein PQC09_gp191 [Synechococcus phage S-N03]QIN96876.1 hypothetical protein [Synechococcus phage S-N03]